MHKYYICIISILNFKFNIIMKKNLLVGLLLSLSTILLSCSNSSSNSSSKELNFTDTYTINTDCFGTIDKASYDEMNTCLTRKDKEAFSQMYLEGKLIYLSKGDRVKVVEMGLGWVKIRFNGTDMYLIRECLSFLGKSSKNKNYAINIMSIS